MSKKIHILFFLLTLGLFLLPSSIFACGNNTAKTSCEKKVTSKERKSASDQNCCNNDNDTHKEQHGCNGKCGHSSCTTSVLHFSLLSTNEFEFHNNTFNFSVESSVPYYKNLSVSDGYSSIWSPPKIN